jgi:histidine ammonia-lyase
MGTNAALMTQKVIMNTFEVMAVQFITIAQAVDSLKLYDKLSPLSQRLYNEIRQLSPTFVLDTVRYPEIRSIATYLKDTQFPINA